MSASGQSGRSLGFDAVRALRNRTGLGNYARGILRGLRQREPESPFHLYSHRRPLADFATLPQQLDAALRVADGGAIHGSMWRTFRLGRVAARDGVDLYHGLSHEIPRDIPDTTVRSVVTFHDLIYEKSPELFRRFDRWSYQWRYRWSAQHADAIVADSRQTRRDLVALYQIDPARIALIPPPRDPRFGVESSASDREAARARHGLPARFALSVGTLEARKNQRILIEAWSQLGADAPFLLLVGRDGGEQATLEALIAHYRLEGRVRIATTVPSADLPLLMQAASAFLYPSRMEGFGMPVVEALSAGKPVLVARDAGVDDAGGPAATFLSPDDPGEWSSAILALAADPARVAAQSALGLRHAATFDADRVAAQLGAVYDAVMAGGPLPADPQPVEASVGQAR